MASSLCSRVNQGCSSSPSSSYLSKPSSPLLVVVRRQVSFGQRRRTKGLLASSPVNAAFILNPPPYELDELEPHISKRTLEFHWGKHHRAYVDNLNKQIENTDYERNTLEEIVTITYNNGNPLPPFNNAAQAWNHEFLWESMAPGGGKKPSGEVLELIERDFGSFEDFVCTFKEAATTQFGSGWVWLVVKDSKLAVEKTPNALNPLIWGHFPLLTIDVWEHAYYLDYQNRRPDYITTFINELISWERVLERLERIKAFTNVREPTIPNVREPTIPNVREPTIPNV
uniref:superoxide dismutase n=1 Tax=Equisetum arvense TaxID=3258 RepID=V5YPA7_EQUAR|nr:chloroplastic Fe-superoxide dismutase [Equisetum arvense]